MGGRRGRRNTFERVSGSTSHMALLAMLSDCELARRSILPRSFCANANKSGVRDWSAKTIRYREIYRNNVVVGEMGRIAMVLKGVCSQWFWLAEPSPMIAVARLQRKATFSQEEEACHTSISTT